MRVLDRLNQPVAGAGITVSWSGLVPGSSSGTTGSDGEVVLTSRRSKKSGTITATITLISAPSSYQLDKTLFAEPLTASIAAAK